MPIALPQSRRFIIKVPLHWVLTVPFMLPTIGAVALVGYLSYQNGQAAVEELGRQLVTETNERVTQELKTYLQTPLLINRLNVDAVNQGQLDLQNIPVLESTLFNRLQQFDQVSAVLFTNPQGKFRLVEQLPDLYLVAANPPRSDQILVYRLDSQGKRGQLFTTLKGFDIQHDRPWYQRAVTTEQPGWSPVSQYGSLELLTLVASQPVYDHAGKRLLGVFAVHLRLDYLSEFLHGLDISRYGQVIITDQNSTLIATSTGEQPYKSVTGTGTHRQFQQLKLHESQDGLTRSLGEYLRDPMAVSQALEQTDQLNFRYNGALQYVKITPFQDQHGLNWQIITVVPKSHFLETVQNHTQQTLLLCLLTLGVAIALGLLAAHQLTVRFGQLNRVSRELAAGNLNQRLTDASLIYELNELSQTFNQMADQLRQSFNRINTALAKSEEKFTTIFRNSPDPMAIASLAECRLLEVNDSLVEFFGYTRPEMIGHTALELNLWSNLEQHDQYITLLQQQGTVRNLEVQLCTKSGQVKTALLSSEVRTLEGQDCVIIVHRDISDRKAAELALQQSELRYRAIIEDQTELISRFLPDTTLLFVNDAYCRYFDVKQEDILGKSYNPIIYKDDREKVAQLVQSINIDNPTVTIENRVVVNGEIRWTQWVNRLLFDEQGNFTEFQAVGRDITALKRTEEALRKSEANLLQAQRIAHVGSWELDLVTQKIIGSEELFHIFGLDPTRLEPSYDELMEIVPAEDRRILMTAINQAIENGTPYEVEHRICRPDGTIRYLISKGQVVLDDRQQIFKLYGTALDITDRKQLEQSLRSQAEQERLLTTITQHIRQSLDLEQILATTVIEVQQTLKADRALIFRLNQDSSGQVIQEAVVPDYPVTDQMRWEDEHFPEDCYNYYRQGIPRIVPDVATDEWAGCLAEFMRTVAVKSKIVAPIVQVSEESSKVWGLLVVHACSHYRQWQASEADFLQQICNQLAIAIDQANLYQQLQAELAERTQAEAALQEREAMLRAIGDNLPKGFIYQRVYEPGKGFYYSYVSAGVERLLGLKPEAVLENPQITRSVGFAEELARADQMVQESLRNLTPIELQMRHRTAQGEIQWSSIRSTPRRLNNGRTVWDGVEVDITDLKRAEAALRASEEQFRRAFDDAPIGVSLVTMAGQFIKVNSRYCDLLGYTEAELLTLTFQEITYPADLDEDLEGVQRMMTGEIDSFQLQKRYITKQGTIIPVLMNAALIRDQDGQPLYSVGHVQDIRDRLKVERMKDEFISVVSHELRTPLTSIRGALGMLGSGVFDNRPERAKHMLQIAIDNSDRLVRLVDDILSLERLKTDKVQLIREQCQVADLMQQAVESVQSLADQAGITLSCAPLVAALYADPDAIVQTLTNLLSNAIKFSSTGNTVWLKAELQEIEELESGKNITPSPHYSHILFTVKDQGRGIPEGKFEVIFEQFQQVDVSDSRKKGGTGLGLAICKKIVQQHHGQIWVESCLGKGSTFYFTLPAQGKQDND